MHYLYNFPDQANSFGATVVGSIIILDCLGVRPPEYVGH